MDPSEPFPALLWAVVIFGIALMLLLAANRRGAWIGLLAAWGAIGGIVLWERCRNRIQRGILIVAALGALCAAALYVRGQARSSQVAEIVSTSVDQVAIAASRRRPRIRR